MRNLSKLNQQGIFFITLRRRSRKMLGEIYSRPASAWQRITLDSLTGLPHPAGVGRVRHAQGLRWPAPAVDRESIWAEEPTVIVTNNLKVGPAALITRYAQRMLIENNISEAIQFFHMDALSSMVGLKVDFDLQLTLMASSLYRLMARRIGRDRARAAETIFR